MSEHDEKPATSGKKKAKKKAAPKPAGPKRQGRPGLKGNHRATG